MDDNSDPYVRNAQRAIRAARKAGLPMKDIDPAKDVPRVRNYSATYDPNELAEGDLCDE